MATLASIIASDPADVLCDAEDIGQSVLHRTYSTATTYSDTTITAVVANEPGTEEDGPEVGGRWSVVRKRVAAPASVWSPTTRSKVVISSVEYDVETVETDGLGSITIATVARRERTNRGQVRR